ncbi:hypothetical protein BUALT_Bualt04G0138800 [Buddleja alternifolia]|uniref:BAG family molecular chaperone regulator 8, chloroplastic n=1 Tax=Buddleja alternifolia TaxID=168488 RepID=A0AAV6XQ43_9LAMI|nr:hypothetical protein BUALT_Bualt04G0138800 [Buddleja alternifolia]
MECVVCHVARNEIDIFIQRFPILSRALVHYHSFQEERPNHPTVSSLLRRIAALESALGRRSSSTSLRDAAARTIQTYFRAFLLRRSRTLRQLKDLAFIKSKLSALKSSVSEQTHFDYDVVYRRAMDLLRRLDSIQGGDPMIRDGKSSIRRELNNFFDFIDGFYSERRRISSGVKVRYERTNVKSKVPIMERKMSNVKCGDLKRENMQKLRGLVERIDKLAEELDEEESEVIESPIIITRKQNVAGNVSGVMVKHHGGAQPKVKKSVSFAEDGKVYRLLRRNRELVLDEDCDDNLVDTERELVDDLCREVEEIGVSSKEADDEAEAHSENEGSLPSSDERHDQDETDSFAFSAPLPLKMETRAGLN